MISDNSIPLFFVIVFVIIPLCGILFFFYTLYKYKKDKKTYQNSFKVAKVILIVSILFVVVTMPRALVGISVLLSLFR